MNCFLGIDPSLSSSGVCILDNNSKILSLNTIKTDRQGDLVAERFIRYGKIIDKLYSIVCQYIFSIDIIAIESYSYGSYGKKDQLYESGALIRNLFLNNKKESTLIIEVSPLSLKKFILGTVKNKGKEAKNLIIKEIYKKYNVDIDNNDEADAFVLAKIAQCYYETINNNYTEDWLSYQKEIIKDIIKKNF